MFPIPFVNYIPKFFTRDDKLTAVSDKADTQLTALKEEILGLCGTFDPIRCNKVFLSELGYLMNAGLYDSDSETLQRKKIAKAVQSHKNRGLWTLDVKIKIDNIAGGDSSLVSSLGADDWVLTGDGNTPSSYYWGTLGGAEEGESYGIRMAGTGEESIVKGNIYIDVDNSTLTGTEITQIENTIYDSIPAYYIIHLGYYIDGTFYEYGSNRKYVATSDGEDLVTSDGEVVFSEG